MNINKRGRLLGKLTFCFAIYSLLLQAANAAPWFPLGPYGGHARSFAADPADVRHLYLGTVNGWLYESHDAGSSWSRISQVGNRDDLVIDHVLVNPTTPKRIVVGVFRIGHEDGGIYISQDGGKHWYEQAELRGQSVRSLARSTSRPQEIVAGTLRGIYRSEDDGTHWKLISPPESKEIHEVESLAIDPKDPNVIYAGTWHLPWKTEDGGENWVNIKQGIIDDSDVFSIIVDPENTNTVYLSACSGIYKSLDAAQQFRKIQGIPSTARRTRKLLQDPKNSDTVYAGTTEGLYKTLDGGRTFARMTEPSVIVNDVYVDPEDSNHILLATERGGVLSSTDGGTTFQASNTGFSAQQISSFAADWQNPSLVYVGLVNEKESGGVFRSADGGLRWEQTSSGLMGRDVFSLASLPDGGLLAGTGHGVFRFEDGFWVESSKVEPSPSARSPIVPTRLPAKPAARPLVHRVVPDTKRTRATVGKSKKIPARVGSPRANTIRAQVKPPAISRIAPDAVPNTRLDAAVYALVTNAEDTFAGTSEGLLRSSDQGRTWKPMASLEMKDVQFLSAQKQTLLAAGFKQMELSEDGGKQWNIIPLPEGLTQIAAVCVDDAGNIWVGGAEGVYYSADGGAKWRTLRTLFLHQVNEIYLDVREHRILVASSASKFAFAVHLPDYKVTYSDSGWPLRFVRPVGDHLIGATLFDGMVLQPQMVDSPLSAGK